MLLRIQTQILFDMPLFKKLLPLQLFFPILFDPESINIEIATQIRVCLGKYMYDSIAMEFIVRI